MTHGRRRRHPGHGRGRAHLLELRDGVARGHRHRDVPGPRPAARRGRSAPTSCCSPSRRSACCWSPSAAARTRCSRSSTSGISTAHVVGRGDRRRLHAHPLQGRGGGRDPGGSGGGGRAVYERPVAAPADLAERQKLDVSSAHPPADPGACCCRRCSLRPTCARRRWVLRAVRPAGAGEHGGAAGRRRRGGARARTRSAAGDEHRLQSALLLARPVPGHHARGCGGGAQRRGDRRRPLAVTNCLNFGNPERPESMWEFARAVQRPGRRVPCARDAGRVGERVASTTRPRARGDPADPDDRHGGPARRRDEERARGLPACRATWCSCSARRARSSAPASTWP